MGFGGGGGLEVLVAYDVTSCLLTHVPCLSSDKEKLQAMIDGEKTLKDENIRLQRKLQRETERSEALSRALSESESSLEIDEERYVWLTGEGHWYSSVFTAAAVYRPSVMLDLASRTCTRSVYGLTQPQDTCMSAHPHD